MSVVVKDAITRVGARCSPGLLRLLNSAVNYLEAGSWMAANGMAVERRVETRFQVFDAIAAEVADRQVLYAEFGVFEGEATRRWSALLRNPASALHGFDSFRGLPERWLGLPPGMFDVSGRTPAIDDPRVEFFVGWFEDTLPGYRPPEHEQLVLMIDSDLYSSAALVLRTLEPIIVPGAYVYFDEFQDRAGELRAFEEFLERTGSRFRVVAASRGLMHVAFQRIA